MSGNNTPPPPERASGDASAVRITGVSSTLADHPAARKIARAVLSIAARRIEEEKDAPSADLEVPHD